MDSNVNVLGGGLTFEAGIDLSDFDAQANKILQAIRQMETLTAQGATGVEHLSAGFHNLVASQDAVIDRQKEFTRLVLSSAGALQGAGTGVIPPSLSQASIDAYKSHREDIISSIQAFKQFQQAGTQALNTVAIGADHLDHSMHGVAEGTREAVSANMKGVVSLKQMGAALEGVTTDWKTLNKVFHDIFHGKSGDQSLGAQWQQIKAGKITLSEFVENLQLTDKQLSALPDKLERVGLVAQGTFTAMANKAGEVQQKMQGIVQPSAVPAGPSGPTPPKGPTGSINEKNTTLDNLKKQYAELSEIDRNSTIGKGIAQNIQQVESELEDINKVFLKVDQNAAGSLNEKIQKLGKLKDQYAALSEVDRKSTAGREMAQNIHVLDTEVQNINAEFTKTESIVKKAAVAVGAYLSLQSATSFVKDVARVRGEFQQLETSFKVILGNKEKADALMNQVVNLAAVTPFTLQEVAGGAKQLLAYGFAADEVTDILSRMGDIAAGTGTDISGLISVLGQVKTKGRLQAEEMLQFAERGVPIISELAKHFNIAESEVSKLVESGKVGFQDVYDSLSQLTNQGGIFFNMTAEMAKTIGGLLSNFSDAWSRMLNDIGKSNEGILSGAIETATTIVNNYETVIDILKVMIATYGAYKTATILAAGATNGYTIAETLRYRAMLLSEAAMKLLNKTMLSNPFVLVATGVAALVSTFVLLRKETSLVKSSQELMAAAQKDVSDKMAEAEAKIRPYVEALKKSNVTEQERVTIYNELLKQDPKLVEGMTAKTLEVKKLTDNVNQYVNALRKQYALEANKDALQASIKQEQAIQKQIEAAQKKKAAAEAAAKKATDTESRGLEEFTASEAEQTIKVLKAQKQAQEEVSKSFGQSVVDAETAGKKTQENKKRTLQVIEDEIKAERNKQTQYAATSKEYQQYQKRILELEEEKRKITGESNKAADAYQKKEESLLTKTNALLQDRKDLLQQIIDLKREADQTGMSKEMSELEKINDKYLKAFLAIDKFNEKVEAFNRKNKTAVQKIGVLDITALNEAKVKETSNTILVKQGGENFKKDLEDQKELFLKFEETVKSIGVAKAEELFREQTKGFSSYLDYLKAEAGKIEVQINPAKRGSVNQAILDEEKRQREKEFEDYKANFQRLLTDTATFNQKRRALEIQYLKDLEFIRANFKGEDQKEQERKLKEKYAFEEKELQNSAIRQSDIYRKMGEDILTFSREDIRRRIKELKDALKSGSIEVEGSQVALSPQMKSDIEEAVTKFESLDKALGKTLGLTSKEWDEIAGKAREVAGLFTTMSDALRPLNENLANTLSQMSEMANVAGSAASAAASFAAGDYVSGSAQSMQVVGSIVKVFADAKASKAQTQAQLDAFLQNQLTGELQYQQLLRQRAILQAQSNKLTLEGLKAQREALDLAHKQNTEEYNRVLKLIQQEQYVTGQHAETGKGNPMFGALGYFLGIGAKTSAVNDMGSLAGMNFDQLEKLFNSGQLSDKAKTLFEQLQKLKQEGVDIDKQLQDLRLQAQEIFTGTTSNGILDSIVEAFRQGKHEAADFADNFEELMRGAMINSLKYKYLEGPLKDFFEQFATASESDGALTSSEIDSLKNLYNTIIENASNQFDQIQQIAGLNLNSLGGGTGNSIQGALRGMSEETAGLLAGQFGGMRLTMLDQLKVATEGLYALNAIQNNTALTVRRLESVITGIDDQTNRLRQTLTQEGVKIK